MKPSLVLMGSKPGSVVALEIALARGWDVRAVVVSKSDPHPWHPGPKLHEVAESRGIDIFVQSEIPPDMKADFVVSYMYRNRVRAETLAMANVAALNFHPGPLPDFGGWRFYNAAILENSPEYGCTCHHMDEGFDTGPLCEVRRFKIDAKAETALSLEKKTQIEMIRLFADILNMCESERPLKKVPQEKSQAAYWEKEKALSLKKISKDATSEEIDRVARAFWYPPYDIAFIENDDNILEIIPNLAKKQITNDLFYSDYENIKKSIKM